MIQRAIAYLQGIRRRDAIESEAAEELQFHLDHEIATHVANGMSPVDARRIALRDLGGLTQVRERVRDVRTIGLSDLARDLRYGVRSLVRTPRFAVVALLTLTLMVGGITTIYTLVDAVLLRPLPYPNPDRLVIVESSQPKLYGTAVPLNDILVFREHAKTFDMWGLFRPGYVESLADARNEPLSVQSMVVTPDLFSMLGIEVALGRALLPSDTTAAAPEVVVISHELWQTLYAGDPAVVGKSLAVRDKPITIVGVTRPGADVPTNWLTFPIMWRPVRLVPDPNLRFTTLGRLREGATIGQGRAELAVLSERLAVQNPDNRGRSVTAITLLDRIVGGFKRVLWIFFGAVTCVLLIGVGNLVSLQLARNGWREREITLRSALGASRWRVVRQLVVESMLLCGAGGVLGLAVAWPAVQLLKSTLPPRFPRADLIDVHLGIALFAIGVSLMVGIVVGSLPAWQASRVDLTRRLNEGGRSATTGAARSRLQRALIVFQTAVALILVIGAGLLANSFYRLISRDAGMQEDGLWVVNASLPSRIRDNAAQTAFWTAALEHVRAIPGVQVAALAVNGSGPLSGGDISEGGIVPEGVTLSNPRDGLTVSSRRVSDKYFETLGMPLLRGRPILSSDTDGAERVVVINELAAASLWPNQDPIGKRLKSRNELKTVIGVIPTYRHSRLDGELSPQMFTPYQQRPSIASSSVLMVRAAHGFDVAAAVTAGLRGLEKDLRIAVATMDDVRWKLLTIERFRVAVLMVFAGTAVFLAIVGIVGLVIYTVGQREREIAVRVTLGAVRRDIVRVASRQAVAPALVGLGVGIVGAIWATRLLRTYLIDIQPLDVPTFASALGVLGLAALVAGVVPARRALKIDPVEALRAE